MDQCGTFPCVDSVFGFVTLHVEQWSHQIKEWVITVSSLHKALPATSFSAKHFCHITCQSLLQLLCLLTPSLSSPFLLPAPPPLPSDSPLCVPLPLLPGRSSLLPYPSLPPCSAGSSIPAAVRSLNFWYCVSTLGVSPSPFRGS